jgi:formylglycine-generating enzyme
MRRLGSMVVFAMSLASGCHDVDQFEPCPSGQVSVAGVCTSVPSCVTLASNCGPAGESCCTTLTVTGGSFYRGFDNGGAVQGGLPVPNFVSNPTDLVQVGTFYLDRYEITIGRFRTFLTAYDAWLVNSLHSGVGADPNRLTYSTPDGGTTTTGWQADEFGSCVMPKTGQHCVLPSAQEVVSDIAARCDTPNGDPSTGDWTPTPGDKEGNPMPCITWYEAMMFCIFDGGRLPTEAEWNFAAAGGARQLAFPWSNPPGDTTISNSLAAYGVLNEAAPVGSYPLGAGPFGQYDLAGNVWEWTLDSPNPSATADGSLAYGGDPNNPVDMSGLDQEDHTVRGGSFEDPSADLRTSARLTRGATDRYRDVGARCARPGSD